MVTIAPKHSRVRTDLLNAFLVSFVFDLETTKYFEKEQLKPTEQIILEIGERFKKTSEFCGMMCNLGAAG